MIAPETISDWLRRAGTLVWVNVQDPGPGELEMLRKEFGFHHLALEDVTKQRQRPKVDEYPNYYFVVLYALLEGAAGGAVETIELDLFVGRNYLVTLHREPIPALQEAGRRWEATDPALRTEVGFLLHAVADAVMDAYFPLVEQIEERLEHAELTLFSGAGVLDPEEFLGIKRSLLTLRKAVYPVREVFNVFLRREHMQFHPDTYAYFQDVYDHVLRLLDSIDLERDMATGALEAQLSVISNRLNATMQRLTVIAVCVAVVGALFGAWGMNFTHVPLDNWGIAGFWTLIGSALLLVTAVLGVTHRRGLW